jgi:hypothetical protein
VIIIMFLKNNVFKTAVIIFADGWQMPDEKGGK